ncbi:hypothetical protein, partial [[Clostridium] scindens]|uniref:hypothetical protein n=1 Tax=Clostridium scindens (strain JCM 10418 / VPI 12708) TaxID=29347 RepID=UPI001D095A16
PIAKQVRAFFLSADHTSLPAACVTEGCPGCRSPPSDFDFAYPLKQIEIGGNTHERNQSAGLLPVLYIGCDR